MNQDITLRCVHADDLDIVRQHIRFGACSFPLHSSSDETCRLMQLPSRFRSINQELIHMHRVLVAANARLVVD